MSLSIALNNALSSLNVNKRALDTISQNIANANTKDYTRKDIDLASQYIDGVGSGVSVSDISRKVDEYLRRSIQSQSANVGMSSAINDFSQRLQTLLGQPGSANSIDNYITSFFGGMQKLAESVDTGSLKLNAVSGGEQLANQLSQLAGDVYDLRFEADQSINAAVSSINNSLSRLYATNLALNDAYNGGNPQSGLLDQRDALLRDLGDKLDMNVFFTVSGEARLSTTSGQPILDGSLYQLSYTRMPSTEALVDGVPLSPITVSQVNAQGEPFGPVGTLVTGGDSADVTTVMVTGQIKGLLTLRDQTLPAILDQLDTLAAGLRDTFNAIHNQGVGYPGANSFTGTRLVNAGDLSQWSGQARIALLDKNGQPITGPYGGAPLVPLTLDFAGMDAGEGAGKPDMQTIIDEINGYYNQPQNKTSLGVLSNIRLRSDSNTLPGSPGQFSFDFDLENLSGQNADFFVNSVQVLNSAGTDITSVTSTIPKITLNNTDTFVTTADSTDVTVNITSTQTLSDGDYVYIPASGLGTIGGLADSNYVGMFQVFNVTSTSFQIQLPVKAATSETPDISNMIANPAYVNAETGEITRARENGTITASLSGQTSSPFYTVRVTASVVAEDGSISTGTMDYKVVNNQGRLLNQYYTANAVSSGAAIITSRANAPLLTAKLVDANGVELAKDVYGKYLLADNGYLKLTAASSDAFIAMDAMDSQQLGQPDASTPIPGTNRSFTHFFELNNFFVSNAPTSTGDTLRNSALNLRVASRISTNPNFITTGAMTQLAPDPATGRINYTYARYVGDNDIIQRLAGLSAERISFAAAGGLGETGTDFNGYAGQILGYVSAWSARADSNQKSAKTLMDGFNERYSSVSGVNLDEELGNTVIYQNAYSASARIITVTNQMFELLFGAFQ